MSFFRNTKIIRDHNHITIHSVDQKQNLVNIEILGKYTSPVFVNYSGNITEVAVVFKPLGINHFLNDNLDKIASVYSQDFGNEIWLNFGELLFKESSCELQIKALESFLISQLQKIDLTLMYNAIKYLEMIENDYTIEEIASLLKMNLKTFQRRFLKHLACSPSDYRRIARFRHSLSIGLIEKEIKNLTAIAYDSNYYDQSYFVREYKKLTSLNPKAFFNTITSLDDNNIIWKIK